MGRPGASRKPLKAGFALAQRNRGHLPEGAVDEVGPAQGAGRQAGRFGHRLHHDPLQGAVTHLSHYQALQELPFRSRSPSEQPGQDLPSAARSIRSLWSGARSRNTRRHRPGSGRRLRKARRPARPSAWTSRCRSFPWGSSPQRYATAMGISTGSRRRRHSARCPILASRPALRVTWADVSASSFSFMRSSPVPFPAPSSRHSREQGVSKHSSPLGGNKPPTRHSAKAGNPEEAGAGKRCFTPLRPHPGFPLSAGMTDWPFVAGEVVF